MTLLHRAAIGGYGPTCGFGANVRTPPVSIVPPTASAPEQAYSEDWRSRQNKPVPLAEHLGHVAAHAVKLCESVGETPNQSSAVRPTRSHDLGKAHKVLQPPETGHASARQPYLAQHPPHTPPIPTN